MISLGYVWEISTRFYIHGRRREVLQDSISTWTDLKKLWRTVSWMTWGSWVMLSPGGITATPLTATYGRDSIEPWLHKNGGTDFQVSR
jgi:hypothetical protein